jgi:hypothetical protein
MTADRIAPDDFARGGAQVMQNAERNPDVDSGSTLQPIGPDSAVDQIVAFGRAAYADVQLGAELRFHGILNTICALHWLKLRLPDNKDFDREADQIEVKRSYAYLLLKLYKHVPELQRWGAEQKQEHGEYPSPWAMLRHCGVGLAKPPPRRGKSIRRDKFIERMQREIERLHAALSGSEAREAELRNKLAERTAEVATLRAELAEDGSPDPGAVSSEVDSRSRESVQSGPAEFSIAGRGQPMEVRFGDGKASSFSGRTGHKRGHGEFTTPTALFEWFGSTCTFDVAATDQNALCAEYFTKKQDALKMPIPPGHHVWANTPYSELDRWCKVLFDYVDAGHGTVTALLPNWSDEGWYHHYVPLGEVTFIKKRWKFGGMANTAPFPSIVVRWTPESIRVGRQRVAQGDHTIVAELVDIKKASRRSRTPHTEFDRV